MLRKRPAIARRVMARFAEQGPTREEFAAAADIMIRQVRKTQLKPAYWSHVLSELDYRHKSLKPLKTLDVIYDSYSNQRVVGHTTALFSGSEQLEFPGCLGGR